MKESKMRLISHSDLIENVTLKAEAESPGSLTLILISIQTYEKEMRELIAAAAPVAAAKGGLYVTISGYDDDPRELWEIPETRLIAERWLRAGGLGIMRADLEDDTGDHPGFSALQMWLLAQGLMNQRVQTTTEMVKGFVDDYRKGCELANGIDDEFRESLARHHAN